MSKKTKTEVTCDRCKRKDDVGSSIWLPPLWSMVAVRSARRTGEREAFHLCVECTEGLDRWVGAGPKEVKRIPVGPDGVYR